MTQVSLVSGLIILSNILLKGNTSGNTQHSNDMQGCQADTSKVRHWRSDQRHVPQRYKCVDGQGLYQQKI